MSQTVDPSEEQPERDGAEKNPAWLERNSRPVNFSEYRDTESWDRAAEGDGVAEYDQTGPTTFWVELPDGERHQVLLVRSEDQDGSSPDIYAGACDCSGYEYHGYCAHLILLGRTDIVNDIVSTVPSRYDELVAGDQEDIDEDDRHDRPDDEDGAEQDDVDDAVQDLGDGPPTPEAYDDESSAVSTAEPQGSTPEDRPAEVSVEAKPDDPALERTPDKGVLDLAPEWAQSPIHERGGEMDLNKDGCQFVAAALGIDTDREFRARAEETDWKYAIVECTARLGDRTVTREATAHIDESNVEKHDMNRMAETRAYKRAVKSISGGGLAAFARSR